MAVIIKTDSTLFRPVMIGLRSAKRGDYRSCICVNSRTEWKPMASCLDWSKVADLNEFSVRARYAEHSETRKESKHATYNGRRDTRRVPGGRTMSRTLCMVTHGVGDHTVYVRGANGFESEQIISEDQVILTVRLFLSTAYLRRDLDIRIDPMRRDDTACMSIRPI